MLDLEPEANYLFTGVKLPNSLDLLIKQGTECYAKMTPETFE
jgi:hypothetical protein